jgi:hypothetical protein
MQKIIIAIVIVIALLAAGIWYVASQTDTLIKQQVEQQGTKYLGTQVTLEGTELSLKEGKLALSQFAIKNPAGFSDNNAVSAQSILLDLGAPRGDAYVVQQFALNVPAILYETDSQGGSNLLTIKKHLETQLPRQDTAQPAPSTGELPLVIIDNVVIADTALALDFSALPVEQFGVEKTKYDITLPSFNLGAIGKPNGIPADQIGAAVTDALLAEVIRVAKAEAKKAAKDAAKKRLEEEVDKQKDKLKEKAKDKLKDLLGG